MRRLALSLLLVLAPIASAAAQVPFRHDVSGLSLEAPDWMYRQGEDLLAPLTLISCWQAPATEDQPWLKMCAERVDELPRADEKLTFRWHERTVEGARVRVRRDDEEVMLYSVLLPLYKGSVRLDVVTPVRGADEARALLESTLATVRDVGRWTMHADDGLRPVNAADEAPATQDWSDRSDRRLARALGKFGMGLIFAGVVMWLRQRRARKVAAESEGGLHA